MNRNHALGFISFLMLAAAGSFVACSSSSTGGTPGVTTDSGTKDTGTTDTATNPADTGTDDTATNPTDTGTTTDSGTCSKPGSLHPPSPDAGGKTIYCPFSAVNDAGNESCYNQAQTAQPAEHCCETPKGSATPSACQPLTTDCVTGSTDWQCEDPGDCPSATPVCCATSASTGTATLVINTDTNCANYASHMTGTKCVAAGACNAIVMCTSTSQCASGQTCTPFTKAGAQVGGCH